ncbi:DUF6708 domain-containing protein [Ralstonia pseudosolanacearum]|nr:DUF6708 domain-containing protein [Ralstonia pseudosolanacearum]USS52062.1 hypothetical protein NHF34_18005 [Ralstonia solanacearum]MDO3563761.1 hypothetical protein [Ralstonia pseudosolanacearum]MDO3573440.1 hypothetical protein [Ralstonia pseudosolanacearum]MDO3614702.1 hypothetical protein [Ralstonia pseudosolanacearum]UNJ31543.1 hypothetical protein MNY32_21880 [Ralstonia pseudosolanacearum]
MSTEYDDESSGPAGKEVLMPVWDKPDPYFEVLDKLKRIVPPRKNPWRIAPDDKHVPTHKMARTRKCLVAIHPNAIAIGSPYGSEPRGLLGWFGFAFTVLTALLCAYDLIGEFGAGHLDLFSISIDLIFGFLCFLFAALFFNFVARTPSDYPILFNKRDRTVTFVRPSSPRFIKFWKFTESGAFTYPWDEVKVRSYKALITNAGKSFHESHYLVMLWGGVDEQGRKVAKECIPVGYFGYFEDERLFQVWEHIRRYMEEGGAPIQPGERLRKPVNNRKPMAFPPEVIAAAGGPALSVADVELLAGVEPAVQGEVSIVE